MHSEDRLRTLSFFLMITGFTLLHIPKSFSQDQQQFETCSEPFRCGNIDFSYPFWGGDRPESCGYPGFNLSCQGNVPRFTVGPVAYRILSSVDTSSQTVTVARDDLWDSNCPQSLHNTTLNFNIFSYPNTVDNITLYYNCTQLPTNLLQLQYQFNCTVNSTAPNTNFFQTSSAAFLGVCTDNIRVPINRAAFPSLFNTTAIFNPADLRTALTTGFPLRYEASNTACNNCSNTGGRCGYDTRSNSFACYPNRNGGKSGPGTPVVLAIVGAVLAGVGLGWLIFWCRQRRRRLAAAKAAESYQIQSKDNSTTAASKAPTSVPSTAFTKSIPSYPSSKTEFGKESSYFGVQVFSYSELEEATDGFSQSRELGDGGFGAVYYGVLTDGRVVAVKRLYENNFKRVEQFINEVEILTRLRHPNLVTLFGCTSKRSRELLLVYEYIPNGTVADHLHGKRASSGLLSWPVRLNIAIETADALAYLHKSDIIHRDVKTNNILLDNDFHVKVADFGLSRLFPNDVTHVSTAPQGTPGYVDPEYYQCYQLTEKSDVYSFGVVLIELISSLQAVDTNRHRHDINLANMAVNKIQNHTLHELVDSSLEFGTNSPMRRMTTLVAELAFRCLQQERDMRPSMQEVVDALRGIQNEGLNTAKVEVVHILVDDVAPLKHNALPTSPDSVVPDKWLSSSTPNSSG
ncbi:LEAF RUST 10 DISEASE-RESISTANCEUS RECEPTOR-LIKE PROTEIN KINASE-like 1.4 isoform X3 [Coffea arabica]|uniref:non-specific serine/threonine protein kinase n=1 Tax=Coffea arabica TaxID=13443 RepID=A0A6P6TD41_COFAR